MAIPACVVAASAEAATTDAHVTFFMLHPPEISIDIAALKRSLDSDRFEIVDSIVSESLTDLTRTDQYTEAMYYRFLLPDVVDASRVIYLDSDTLVRRSLLDLYTVDLVEHPVAAAVDHGFTFHMRANKMPVTYEGSYISIDEYCLRVLQFDLSSTQYFNNGVLVIDLDRWRAAGLSQRCIAFCRANPGLGMADQDAANHVLQGDFARLDTRWNAISYLLGEYFPDPASERAPIFGGFEENFRQPAGEWHEILMQWAYDPWIVHFAYLSKPWKPDHRRTGYEAEYWRQADRTPFGTMLRERGLLR
jgi:lipopolysaccharide biosynthesis glycosyltransferase